MASTWTGPPCSLDYCYLGRLLASHTFLQSLFSAYTKQADLHPAETGVLKRRPACPAKCMDTGSWLCERPWCPPYASFFFEYRYELTAFHRLSVGLFATHILLWTFTSGHLASGALLAGPIILLTLPHVWEGSLSFWLQERVPKPP